MRQSRIEILQRMPIFGAVREDMLKLVLDLSQIIFVPQGGLFFREGDRADSMFVLEAGKVEVVKGERGKEYLIRNLGEGDCFGEMGLIDLFPRSASVRAIENCTAIEISTATLHKIYEQDVEQFAIIEMNIGRELSRRLRQSEAVPNALPARDDTR
jgi:CRP-like cAMP-binding protein